MKYQQLVALLDDLSNLPVGSLVRRSLGPNPNLTLDITWLQVVGPLKFHLRPRENFVHQIPAAVQIAIKDNST